MAVKVDTVFDLSDRALGELKAWLEPWWQQTCDCMQNPGHAGVPIEDAYNIPGAGLQYWYRLGEAGPWPVATYTTSNFALDSSGNNRHLTALNWDYATSSTAVKFTDPADPNLPTCDVTGALEGGNANDGGIQFNWLASSSVSPPGQVMLQAPSGTPIESTLSSVGDASTFAAWIAYVVGSGGGSGTRPIVSTQWRDFGIGNHGAGLGFDQATGHLVYDVGEMNYPAPTGFTWTSDFAFVDSQWYHFAMSIERLGTDLYHRRIWINTNLVYEITGTQVETGATYTAGLNLALGMSNDLTPASNWTAGRGKLDEVAYWSSALTQAQINDLWNARVLNSGDTWGATVFYSAPVPLPVIPATPTAQDIADVLVALGLATQL